MSVCASTWGNLTKIFGRIEGECCDSLISTSQVSVTQEERIVF